MGDPYTSQTITGYNTNPPPDDGTQSADNEITWAKHKNKLGDPLKTLAEAINTEVSAAFGRIIGGGDTSTITSNTTVSSSQQGDTIRVNGSGITLTTPDATSVGSPFIFNVFTDFNDGLIVDGSGAQTVNGETTITIPSNTMALIFTDGSNWFAQYSGMPVGALMSWATPLGSEPKGWLACDGQAVSRTTYAALFAAVSTTYGVGDGSTTFNVPDLRGGSPIGTNDGGLPNGESGSFSTRNEGDNGGEESHQLTVAELPSHSHTYDQPSAVDSRAGGGLSDVTAINAGTNTSSVGSDSAHNNMQPFVAMNFLIKT